MSKLRLDLGAIEASLRAVQRDFDRINAALNAPHDPLREEVVDSMLAGYRYLDELQARDLDMLARGQSGLLLRLNCMVICRDCERGIYPEPRVDLDLSFSSCSPHFRETERRFYDDTNQGGVRALMNYLADHRYPTVWRRAAAVYTQALSEPQLFFEGNHRTGVLLMSHVLLRGGLPPFVLTPGNAVAYFESSAPIKGYRKRSFQAMRHIPRLQRQLAEFLERSSDPVYVLPEDASAARAEGLR